MTSDSHPADLHDVISVRQARENNLKGVDVDIPKRRLTVFTGVSGSGKSSLVFGTIAAESQRMINETYPSFVQGFMPSLNRPDVDALTGLTPAIVVDQERLGANARSTVGTVTDAGALLRTLFAAHAEPHIGGPNAYSFNVPSVTGGGSITVQRGDKTMAQKKTYTVVGGMCPRCEGMGNVTDLDLAELFDETKMLQDGPFTIPGYTGDGWAVRIMLGCGLFPPDRPIKDFTVRQRHEFLYGEPRKVKIDGVNLTYEGLIPKLQKSMLSKDKDAMQPHIRAFVERAVTFITCPECAGTRLSEGARTSQLAGKTIADVCALPIGEVAAWAQTIDAPSAAPIVKNLTQLCDAFVQIGLGYLSLDRPSGTLSGGEAQRTTMIRHLGSALTDVTYVFDEPTVGLHPHDMANMNRLLRDLRDKGNTVLVVEHKPETMAMADYIVDMGPEAGADGGEICFTGTYEQLRTSDTPTGRHLDHRVQLKAHPRTHADVLAIRNASTHNLQAVDVDIPLGVLTVVTGVAGSGKSSLIHGALAKQADVVTIDQSPIKGSRRSNPATYTGLLDPIRKAFAKANGVKPALFSNNSDGACPACKGAGLIFTELGFMETVSTVCQECDGQRFNPDALAHLFGDKNIAEVLAMSVTEAQTFFSSPHARVPAAVTILQRLADVGLGYLTIGQQLTTLSGGERQRLKLATHLGTPGGTYVLDEPTTGLHLADVDRLLALLDHLVDAGKTVIVIEHHQAVVAHADWLIDLGPGAGQDGGRIVFTGTPKELVDNPTTLTGQHLAAYLSAGASHQPV